MILVVYGNAELVQEIADLISIVYQMQFGCALYMFFIEMFIVY